MTGLETHRDSKTDPAKSVKISSLLSTYVKKGTWSYSSNKILHAVTWEYCFSNYQAGFLEYQLFECTVILLSEISHNALIKKQCFTVFLDGGLYLKCLANK